MVRFTLAGWLALAYADKPISDAPGPLEHGWMKLPQFRRGTLKIIVAVAALECWLLIHGPLVGLFLLGPLIGSPLMGALSRDRLHGLLIGGVAGGLVEASLFVLLLESAGLFNAPGSGTQRTFYIPWIIANVMAGFGVGLAFVAIYVLKLAVVGPANPDDSSKARSMNTTLNDSGRV